MARIPTTVATRSLETGGVVQYPTSDPVGAALTKAGADSSDLAAKYHDSSRRIERFKAIQEYNAFDTETLSDLSTKASKMEPGGVGFHQSFMTEDYAKRKDEFLSRQPAHLRPEFEARFTAHQAKISALAAHTEFKEGQRFQAEGIVNRVGEAGKTILEAGPGAVPNFVRDLDEMIDAGTLSPADKADAKKKIRADLETTGFRALAARDPAAAQAVSAGWGLGRGGVDQVVDRIIGVESGGRADAKNPNSSATGAGQFIESTWIDQIRKNRPDLMEGKSREQILALRTNATLSREMTRSLAQENASKLSAAGIPTTAGNIYLAHFLGSGGAITVLKAGQDAPISGIVGADAIAANRSILEGKTAGQVAAWATTKMGGEAKTYSTAAGPDPRFNNVPPEKRLVLAEMADRETLKMASATAGQQSQEYQTSLNDLKTRIIDNAAGHADVDQARKDGWLTDADHIRALTNQISQRDKGMADTQNFHKAMASPGFVWNPLEKDHKDMADAGFTALGGDMKALQTVAEHTGIVPGTAAVAMRGSLLSPDARRVESALQTAANLVGGKYPNIFAGADGAKDLTEAAHTFRDYVYGRGMTAADATRKIMEERTPEFEAKVKAKFKKEDVDKVVKDNLGGSKGIDDIRGAFDQVPWVPGTDPQLAFDPQTRRRALADYEVAFRDRFERNGDIALSKKLALEEMKVTWGVTQVNGSNVVMKYPPDRARAYAGIENVGGHVAMQAAASIKEWNGADVDRKSIRIDEIKGTAERFVRGEAPTYSLSYTDKNGNVQTIPRPFFADPAAMRDVQVTERHREAQGIMTDMAERRAPSPERAARREMRRQIAVERDQAGRANVISRGEQRWSITRGVNGSITGFEEMTAP